MRESLVPIKHTDSDWAVAQRIELAPGSMVIRELLQNAIESTGLLTDRAERAIRFNGVEMPARHDNAVRKLAIWNRGPGMDVEKIVRVMDLAASGDEKHQGADANFGVGAKTAGLKASPEGLRYRSCHHGTVHEVVLCCRRGRYGKLKRQIANTWEEVWDVTDRCRAEGYDLSLDWTEVVLLGLTPDHDTVADLFLESDQGWLAQYVNRRFYDLAEYNLTRHASALVAPRRRSAVQSRPLLGLKHCPCERDEIVPVTIDDNRLSIRYAIRGQRVSGEHGYTAHACLVYANECFDYFDNFRWLRLAPRFGVPYGQGGVFVQVLLPPKFPARFDQYRQNLVTPDRDHTWQLEDFQQAIFNARPAWLIDYIESKQPPQLEDSEHLKKRLRDLQEYLKWQRQFFKADAEGKERMLPTAEHDHDDAPTQSPKAANLNDQDPDGIRPASAARTRRGDIPHIEWVDGGTSRQPGEMSERAARYDRARHTIRLNVQYERFRAARDLLIAEFQHAEDQGALTNDAWRNLQEEVKYRAIKHVLLGRLHESFEHWSIANVKDALNDGALTVPLSDTRELADAVRPRLTAKYGKAR